MLFISDYPFQVFQFVLISSFFVIGLLVPAAKLLGMSNYLVNSYMLGAIIFILGFVILIVTDNAPSGIFLLVAVESLIALTLLTLLLIRHSQRRLV